MAADDVCGSPPTPFELRDLPGYSDPFERDVTTGEELLRSALSQNEVVAQSSVTTENSLAARETCVVCGDHAPGRNFGVVSCGSCKAFFRRNALKSKIAACQFSGSCSMTKDTRSFCPSCRIKKCLSAGMKTDRIMSQEDKLQRKELIERKRNSKEHRVDSVHSKSRGGFERNSEIRCESGLRKSVSNESTTGDELKSRNEGSMKSRNPPIAADNEISRLPAIAKHQIDGDAAASSHAEQPVSVHTVSLVISSRSAAVLQHVQSALSGSALRMQRRLLSGDEAELGCLACNYQTTVGVDSTIEMPEPPEGFSAQLFASRTSHLMRQMVRFAKKSPHFASLSRSTQVRLLRAGAVPCILLRSSELLDLASRSWVYHSGSRLSLEDLKKTYPGPTLDVFFAEHLTLSASVKQQVPADTDGRSDGVVFALLLIIVLLSPDNVGEISDCSDGSSSSGPATVSDAQLYYVRLLRRHLEATYSFELCASMLPELLQKITVLKRYTKRQKRGFMSYLTVRSDPLCQEVLGP